MRKLNEKKKKQEPEFRDNGDYREFVPDFLGRDEPTS